MIAAAVLIPAKFVIYFVLLHWQRFDGETTFLGCINMVQVSEFGLIVGAVTVAGEFIDEAVLGFLTLVARFMMAASVYLIQCNTVLFGQAKPWLASWVQRRQHRPEPAGFHDHVIIVGFDEFARRTIELLDDHYDEIVVIDTVTFLPSMTAISSASGTGDTGIDSLTSVNGSNSHTSSSKTMMSITLTFYGVCCLRSRRHR